MSTFRDRFVLQGSGRAGWDVRDGSDDVASLKRPLESLTNKHDVESESTLQKLVFDLLRNG